MIETRTANIPDNSVRDLHHNLLARGDKVSCVVQVYRSCSLRRATIIDIYETKREISKHGPVYIDTVVLITLDDTGRSVKRTPNELIKIM